MTPISRSARREIAKRVFKNLNACIDAATDSEKGFAVAAGDVRDPGLKSRLFDYATERASFVRDLQGTLRELGAMPANGGTARGTAHRGFMEVRAALAGPSDQIVVAECERGERAALRTYDDAFVRLPLDILPPHVRALLIDQRAKIANTCEDLERRRFVTF